MSVKTSHRRIATGRTRAHRNVPAGLARSPYQILVNTYGTVLPRDVANRFAVEHGADLDTLGSWTGKVPTADLLRALGY